MEKAWLGIVAFVIAWFIAQLTKTVIGVCKGDAKKQIRDFGSLVGYFSRSGGMPSGHAASFTAMTVFIGCLYGVSSGPFVVAACTWIIIIYDAMQVRYAVGKQGEALNNLLKQDGQPALPIVEGHTLPQVIVGTLLGLVTGILIFCLFV